MATCTELYIDIYRHIGRTGLGWIDGQKSPSSKTRLVSKKTDSAKADSAKLKADSAKLTVRAPRSSQNSQQ